MLSFDENVSRTYEMKKPFFHRECSSDVQIRTKHHDMRSQKALVFISGEFILITFSYYSIAGSFDVSAVHADGHGGLRSSTSLQYSAVLRKYCVFHDLDYD